MENESTNWWVVNFITNRDPEYVIGKIKKLCEESDAVLHEDIERQTVGSWTILTTHINTLDTPDTFIPGCDLLGDKTITLIYSNNDGYFTRATITNAAHDEYFCFRF